MEFQLACGEKAVIIAAIENKYYFKIKKYKANKTRLYQDTNRLIKESKWLNIYCLLDIYYNQ